MVRGRDLEYLRMSGPGHALHRAEQ
jgi:hypothetical protein